MYLTASDGQWPAANLAKMFGTLEDGADLVVGVRSNRNQVYGAMRRIISFLFNLLPRMFFGVKTADAGSIKLGIREVFNFGLISHSPFVEAERIIPAQSPVSSDIRAHRNSFAHHGKERGASLADVRRSLVDCFRCLGAYGFRSGWPDS